MSPSIAYARTHTDVYYWTLGLYNLGYSPLVGIVRATIATEQFSALVAMTNWYFVKVESEQPPEKLSYRTLDEQKIFWAGQLLRAISEITLPILSTIFWTLSDLSYQRPESFGCVEEETHNFLGFDEMRCALAWRKDLEEWLEIS